WPPSSRASAGRRCKSRSRWRSRRGAASSHSRRSTRGPSARPPTPPRSPAPALAGLDALTLVTFAGPATAPETPARAQETENAACLTALTHHAAAAALPGPVTTIPLAVYEDLVAVRTRGVTLRDRPAVAPPAR